jgi:rare lipoprotein A
MKTDQQPSPSVQSKNKTPNLPDGAGGIRKVGKPYKVAGRWYHPVKNVSAYDQTGIASWYGRDFDGKLTANGEHYDMHALSAAHTTLPMPTLVRVTNLENGRSVVVRINDRGPFIKNRLIDLSYAAARQLGYEQQGTARVRVQTLDLPASDINTASNIVTPISMRAPAQKEPAGIQPVTGMFIQLGTFSLKSNAERLRTQLLSRYPSTRLHPIQIASQTLFRVRIGPFKDMGSIEQTVRVLQTNGFNEAIIIIE